MVKKYYRDEHDPEFDIKGSEIVTADIDTLEEELLKWAGTYHQWYIFELASDDYWFDELVYSFSDVREYMSEYDGGAPGCSGASIIVTSDDPISLRRYVRNKVNELILSKRSWIKEMRKEGVRFYPEIIKEHKPEYITVKPEDVNNKNMLNYVEEILKISCGTGLYSSEKQFPSGVKTVFRFSWSTGMASRMNLGKYKTKFGRIPSWIECCHPYHCSVLCEFSIRTSTPLPDEVNNLESFYFEKT